MKENIYTYSLSTPEKSVLMVYSEPDKACNIAKINNINYLYINMLWNYSSLNWGNYTNNQLIPAQLIDHIYIKIN